MSRDPGGEDGGKPSIDSVRSVVRAVAAELRSNGASGAADRLEAASDRRSSAADELLGLREALVATRPDWDRGAIAIGREAARALGVAKRLAIEL